MNAEFVDSSQVENRKFPCVNVKKKESKLSPIPKVGKPRPRGHMRPDKLFNPACRVFPIISPNAKFRGLLHNCLEKGLDPP